MEMRTSSFLGDADSAVLDRRHGSTIGAPAYRPDSERSIEVTPRADAREVEDVTPRPRSESLCRAMNVAIAATALLLLLPILLLVALAVKLTSPGPIFYLQTRVGIDRRTRRSNGTAALYDRRAQDLGGQVFTIYKFRSMRADAEKGSGAVWAVQRDPRVTPVGRFIRTTRLDE